MIGKILKHRYKIIKELGSGGFGKAYIAEDLNIPIEPKPKCVVKMLQPNPDNQNIPKEDILRLFYHNSSDSFQVQLEAY